MNIVLWIVAAVLAVVFVTAGLVKVSRPRRALAGQMAWVQDFSDAQVKGIGVLELAGAIGLIVPALVGVATVLTPLAAAGLVLLMSGAALTHARRREPQMIVLNGVLLTLAAFVAWARFGPYHF